MTGLWNRKFSINKPGTQLGESAGENVVPSSHVTVETPVRVCPGLHFKDTSSPGGTWNWVSVFTSSQLEGRPSHETVDWCLRCDNEYLHVPIYNRCDVINVNTEVLLLCVDHPNGYTTILCLVFSWLWVALRSMWFALPHFVRSLFARVLWGQGVHNPALAAL